MRSAAFTIKVFGIYVAVTGVGLLLAPGTMLSLFGLPVPTEIWVKVLGVLAIVVGYYYWTCGSAGAQVFIKATIPGRLTFSVLCVALVAVAAAPLPLLAFALVDLLGAAWTAVALRRERLESPGAALS